MCVRMLLQGSLRLETWDLCKTFARLIAGKSFVRARGERVAQDKKIPSMEDTI